MSSDNSAVDANSAHKLRRLSRQWRVCEVVLLTSIPVLGIAFLSDLSIYVNYAPWQEQYVALVFGNALAVLFISVPATGSADQNLLPAYDKALSAVSLAIGFYGAWRWPQFAMSQFVMPLDLIVALAMIGLVLEATRRSIGNVLFGLGIAALIFALTAAWAPGPLRGRSVDWDRLAIYLYTDSAGIPGLPLTIVATVVLAFILFGTVLFIGSGGQAFIDLALAMVGRFRGGPAKAAVVASSLFGSISGSAVSNAVTTGSFTIPLMKQTGYGAQVAAGVEAVASTGGQLLPPVMGISAFIMADFLGVPYAKVAVVALIPALLFYLCLFVQVHLEAVKTKVQPLRKDQVPRLGPALINSWILVVPLGVLVYVLFILNWHATKAGLIGAVVAYLIELVHRKGRFGVRPVLRIFEETGRRMLDILVICALAGIVIGCLSATGASFNFSLQLVELAGGNVFVLLALSAVLGIILGMGMPTAGVYILLAVLAAPALIQLGINEMAAHLFVLYFGMLSMITPPICIVVFATAAIAGAENMRTGVTAMRLGGASYVIPFMFALSPTLILQEGSVLDIVREVSSATLGVAVLGVALVGYLFRPLRIAERILLGVSCLLLAWPDGADGLRLFFGLSDVAGGMLLIGLAPFLLRRTRRVDPDVGAVGGVVRPENPRSARNPVDER